MRRIDLLIAGRRVLPPPELLDTRTHRRALWVPEDQPATLFRRRTRPPSASADVGQPPITTTRGAEELRRAGARGARSGRSGAHRLLLDREKPEPFAQHSMVPAFGLGQQRAVSGELLLGLPRRPANPLQHRPVRVPAPVAGCNCREAECSRVDLASADDMRASAKIPPLVSDVEDCDLPSTWA